MPQFVIHWMGVYLPMRTNKFVTGQYKSVKPDATGALAL